MRVIDAHVHFWDLGQGNQPWLNNPQPNLLGDYSPMARDFGPADLLAAAQPVEIEAAVHIEADAIDPVAETAWLASLPAAPSNRDLPSALVIGADLSQPDARATIERQFGVTDRIRGVRQILNVHADPLFDYVGRHYMAQATWRENFALLAELGLSFDLQIYPSQMSQAAALAANHPDVTFVLNHAGMYVDRIGVAGWREWRDGLRVLARHDNVVIKLSGFGMLDHDWTLGSIRPLIFEAIDAFGVERCLFASNYPVDGLYAGYDSIWNSYDTLLTNASDSEREALFAANARRVYRLS